MIKALMPRFEEYKMADQKHDPNQHLNSSPYFEGDIADVIESNY